METFDCIKTRRSIRKFKDKEVSQKLIDQIIEAGLYAPSARGLQSTIIIQIKDEEIKSNLIKLNAKITGREEHNPFYDAPVILIVLGNKACPNYLYDGPCALENMMLEAHNLGLGSVWIHRAKEEFEDDFGKDLLKRLKIEGEYEGIGHVAIGYPDMENPLPALRKENRVYKI